MHRLPSWHVVALTCVVASCGVGPDSNRDSPEVANEPIPLLILAASDLQAALPEIVARFEATSSERTQVMLGSTGNLTAQIQQGAPGDVFLAANESFIDTLVARGLTYPATRRIYAVGPLALVTSPGVRLPDHVAELSDPTFGTIAIANPEHAPYGMAAKEVLHAVGVWDQLSSRLVFGENIAHAWQFVRTGNADAGIVALGLVTQGAELSYRRIDPTLHKPLRQTAVVLRSSGHAGRATAFLDFLMSDESQTVLQHYGFERSDRR